MLVNAFLFIFGALPVVSYACTHGALRLVNGPSASSGRLEICYNNAWGTVCDDYFDSNNARVACRQLGYSGDAMFRCCAHYGQGGGSVYLKGLECSGNEAFLLNCAKVTISHTCSHAEDVGLICLGQNSQISQKGATEPMGIKGQKGDNGTQGPEGPQGPIGLKGVRGDTGPQGPIGLKGVKGNAGSQGPVGPQGLTGLKGVKGDSGLKGVKGDTGLNGVKGDTGLKGVKGDTGLKGIRGDTGLKGETGGTGPKGETGERGHPGLPVNMTDLKIQEQQAIKTSTDNIVPLSYSSIAVSGITFILVIILLLKIVFCNKKNSTAPPPPPPLHNTYNEVPLQTDIHTLNKLKGGNDLVCKPEEEGIYETMNLNS